MTVVSNRNKLKTSRSKKEYLELKFRNERGRNGVTQMHLDLKVKRIKQIEKFRYSGSVVQVDGETVDDIKNWTM